MQRLPGLFHALRRKSAVRAVGLMASTSALGQLAVFATLPLLTRLYDPTAFGQHALFMAFVGVASVSVCLCLDQRIVSTADESEADNVFAAALMAVVFTAVLSAAVLAALIALSAFGYGSLSPWAVAVMALMLALNGVFSACRGRVVRQQDYRLIARTGLRQNIGRALAPLALYPLAPFWFGLSGGEVAGRMLGVRSIARPVWSRRLGTVVWRQPRPWWQLVCREYRFTGVLMGTALVDAFASQMIVPLLSWAYGAHDAGAYFVAALVIVGPSVLIGSGASDVIHAKGAELHRTDRAALPRFTQQAAGGLLVLALVIFLPVYAIAPYALPVLFGPKWPDLGEIVRALTPFAIAGFVASPCSRLLASVNRPVIKLVSDVVRLVGVPVTISWSAASGASFTEAAHHLGWFLAGAYTLYFALTYAVVVASSPNTPTR